MSFISELYAMSETDILNSLIYEKSKIIEFVELCENKLQQKKENLDPNIWGGNRPNIKIYIQPEYIGVYPFKISENQYRNFNSWTKLFIEVEYSTNPNFKYFLSIRREFQQETNINSQYYLQNIFTNNLFEEFDKIGFCKETWQLEQN